MSKKKKDLDRKVVDILRERKQVMLQEIADSIGVHVSHASEIVCRLKADSMLTTERIATGVMVRPTILASAVNPLTLPMNKVAQAFA